MRGLKYQPRRKTPRKISAHPSDSSDEELITHKRQRTAHSTSGQVGECSTNRGIARKNRSKSFNNDTDDVLPGAYPQDSDSESSPQQINEADEELHRGFDTNTSDEEGNTNLENLQHIIKELGKCQLRMSTVRQYASHIAKWRVISDIIVILSFAIHVNLQYLYYLSI